MIQSKSDGGGLSLSTLKTLERWDFVVSVNLVFFNYANIVMWLHTARQQLKIFKQTWQLFLMWVIKPD